jgi:apolipoprotein N-acyltransferase
MQIASVIGVPGLGMLTLVLAGTPVLFWQSRRDGWRATVFSALMVGLLAVWGAWRIPLAPVPVQPDIRLRLVQASIAQSLKWQEGAAERNFLAQIRLSLSPAEKPVTDIIWPETAVQFYLDIDENARRALADIVPQGGLMLVGAVRGRFEGRRLAEIWNSLQVVDKQGALLGSYDKAHLVPYGEYMPLPKWLPLSKLTVGGMDFSPGPGPRTLDLPGLPPVAPMICYDDVFPTEIVDPAHRPGWMLLVTNDAWFGVSSGPYQHFAASRMRAVEQGLPLVRAANTGISGAIDPYGRVLATLGLGETGVLDVDLPQPLAETIFARWGNRMMILLLVITVGLALSTEFFGRRRGAS